jgi:uncharacterized OB-fold protein
VTIPDEDVVAAYPRAAITPDNRDLYAGWLEGELRINRCRACGHWYHPPRPLCPSCWSFDVGAQPVRGLGTIQLSVLLRQGPMVAGVTYPHPVVAVELDEQPGLRMAGTMVGCEPEAVAIGMRVKLTWVERDGTLVPAFTRLDATTA